VRVLVEVRGAKSPAGARTEDDFAEKAKGRQSSLVQCYTAVMDKNELKKWETKSSTYVVNDRWMKLRADTYITPTGHEISPFYVIEYGEWVNCLVLSDNNEVTLLRHYRHGVHEYVLEVVGGLVDEGESPETTVRRELEEELGLKGAAIHQTGVCYPNPQIQTNKTYSFIALGGTFDGNQEYEPGADFQIVKMPLAELIDVIENQSETMQSLHLTSIFFALNFLKKHPHEAE
jgi:ADP-ribose pyrophosphatase